MTRPPLSIGSATARAGTTAEGELFVARQISGTSVALPIRLVHGADDGPTVWISAAIHGDEIGGVEIIRRALEVIDARTLAGSIIAVPIVNVFGFLGRSRYLPDGRDLNRSFPGSAKGSLAARLANLFTTEVVDRCDVGIDLHTGSDHRTNLPQIRADLDDPVTRDLAAAFGAPLNLHSRLRDGSLREIAVQRSARVLLYEAGEAHRFDTEPIETGVDGILRVLDHLEMTKQAIAPPAAPPLISRDSRWIRARRSGISTLDVDVGDQVARGDRLAVIRDAFGATVATAKAPNSGIVIGLTRHPLVNQGDAIIHLASLDPADNPGHLADGPTRTNTTS